MKTSSRPSTNSSVAKLVKRYGTFNDLRNKFESTSNSVIARDLFYSDSQFSRLINNTASEGEFKRALGNIERLLDLDQLRKNVPLNKNTNTSALKRNFLFLVSGLLLALFIISFLYYKKDDSIIKPKISTDDSRYEMLKLGI